MSQIKPSSHGIVVEHKETEIRYAVSDRNYNQDVHRKVRDLKPGETVRGFKPLRKGSLDGTSSEATSTMLELDLDKATNKPEAPAKPSAPETK